MSLKPSNSHQIDPEITQSEEKKREDEKVSDKVKEFCSETTAHGVGKIVKDGTPTWLKILWLVIVILVLSGSIFHMTNVILVYTEYPSQEYSYLSESDPEFPYVTICNTQAMSFNHTAEFAADLSTDYAQYLAYVDTLRPQMEVFHANGGVHIDNILLSPKGIFDNVQASTVEGLGHSLKDFVLECSYLTEPCDMDNDWIHYLHSDYFNCYTYIGGARSNDFFPGPANGLNLILYMENVVNGFNTYNNTYNTYSNIQNAFSARLDIHGPKTLPNPAKTGIDAMPGHSTSIGLKQSKTKKLPKPHGDCTEEKKLEDLNEFAYTTTGCVASCLTKYVFDNCGCVVLYSPATDSIQNDDFDYCLHLSDNPNIALRALLNNTGCMAQKRRDFITNDIKNTNCNCKEACDYKTHDVSASQSIWPASVSVFDMYYQYVVDRSDATELLAYNQLIDEFNDAYNGVTDGSTFAKLVDQNFARINVYFESQEVLQREQTASMTLADLFANIGGTIGLWAGLSVVTFMEFVSFLVSLCAVMVSKCKGNAKTAPIDNEQNVE